MSGTQLAHVLALLAEAHRPAELRALARFTGEAWPDDPASAVLARLIRRRLLVASASDRR